MAGKLSLNIAYIKREYTNGKSGNQIAKQLGVHPTTIYRRLHKLNTPIRSQALDLDIDKIEQLYKGGLSCPEIGKMLGIHALVINHRLKKMGIPLRNNSESHSLKNGVIMGGTTYRNKEWLIEQYIVKERSISDIAKDCGIGYKAIYKYFDRYEIERIGNRRKIKDLFGKMFGRLIAIYPNSERKSGGVIWFCKCACGNTINVKGASLISGHTYSCGCLHKDVMAKTIDDITGQKFGRWSVISLAPKRTRRETFWLCECDCGVQRIVRGSALRGGESKSCGCLAKEMNSERRGDKNPVWNPNLTSEERQKERNYPEYREWRDAVYKRDHYTCQKCGNKVSGTLNAHHIESYNTNKNLRTELQNGSTLCIDCHNDFHHIYGYGNNTREQFDEFMLIGDCNDTI